MNRNNVKHFIEIFMNFTVFIHGNVWPPPINEQIHHISADAGRSSGRRRNLNLKVVICSYAGSSRN